MAGIFSKLFSYLRRAKPEPFSGKGSVRTSTPLPRRGGTNRRAQKIAAELRTSETLKDREVKRLAELRAKLDTQSQQEFDKIVRRVERGTDVSTAEWHRLNSSNVDRVRYGTFDRKLQVVFKNGALYEYDGVEPMIFQRMLQTHSPGQFVWYVLRAYGYPYRKLSGAGSLETALPAAARFEGFPFAVSKEIQAAQRRAGRGGVDVGVPVAKGVKPPPLPAKFWKR